MQIRPPHKDKTVTTKSDFMNEFSKFSAEEPWSYEDSFFARKTIEKKELRKLSSLAGSAVLLYVFIQNAIFIIVELFGLLDLYNNNYLFSGGIDILMTVLGVFLPFSLVSGKMKNISGEKEPVLSEMPDKSKLFLLGAFGATGCVMLSNIISSYITYFISLIGYELSAPDINMPDGFSGFALSMIRVSILTAIVEEYALRGHVLGNLRKYGDAFAVIMSAAIFALMHGNLIQVPFALLSGVALAVFTLKTKSIWPAVVAHAINNGLSVIITYLMEFIGEDPAMVLYTCVMYILIVIGIVTTVIFAFSTGDTPLGKPRTVLKPIEKACSFLFTPPTLLAFIVMVIITARTVSQVG